jgi:hypothetical protein
MTELTQVKEFNKKKNIFRAYQIVWYILGIIESLLLLRLILRFLAANPSNPFANLIYSLSGVFTYPFSTLFSTFQTGNSVLEISTLFAMLIYWLLAWALVKILQLAKPVSSEEVVDSVDSPDVRL